MNGRGQLYMNLGITLILGAYGIAGALYGEFLKPDAEQSSRAIAIDSVSLFIALSLAINCLIIAGKNYNEK